MDEIEFWKDLIARYLESFEKKFATQKEKEEDDKLKERNKAGLVELRDQMVFSIFMLNAIFVVIVALFQQEKETISIQWFVPKETNGTFLSYEWGQSFPTVRVTRVYLSMDPIGFVFLFFFAAVIIIQVIGMVFHRWETISHIISDTKLKWFERAEFDDEAEMDMGDEEKSGLGPRRSSVRPNDVLAVSAELQKEGTFRADKSRKGSTTSAGSVDSITRLNTKINSKNDENPRSTGSSAHRKTITDMKNHFAKTKGEGEFVDLEKTFRKQFNDLDVNTLENSSNPVIRRLSARRGTIGEMMNRRKSYKLTEQRRLGTSLKKKQSIISAIDDMKPRKAFVGSKLDHEGFVNIGFAKDLDQEMVEDEMDSALEGSNMGSAYSRNSQQFEYVDDFKPPVSESTAITLPSNPRYNSKGRAPTAPN